jgi:hypothetical protein
MQQLRQVAQASQTFAQVAALDVQGNRSADERVRRGRETALHDLKSSLPAARLARE